MFGHLQQCRSDCNEMLHTSCLLCEHVHLIVESCMSNFEEFCPFIFFDEQLFVDKFVRKIALRLHTPYLLLESVSLVATCEQLWILGCYSTSYF